MPATTHGDTGIIDSLFTETELNPRRGEVKAGRRRVGRKKAQVANPQCRHAVRDHEGKYVMPREDNGAEEGRKAECLLPADPAHQNTWYDTCRTNKTYVRPSNQRKGCNRVEGQEERTESRRYIEEGNAASTELPKQCFRCFPAQKAGRQGSKVGRGVTMLLHVLRRGY